MRFLTSVTALIAAAAVLAPVSAQAPTSPAPTAPVDIRAACGADAHALCLNETSSVNYNDDDDDDDDDGHGRRGHGNGNGNGNNNNHHDDDNDDRRRCRHNGKCPRRPFTALQCLYNHRTSISSSQCAAVVAATPYAKCQNDIARWCSYAGSDLQEIQYCITNNKVVLSNQCFDALKSQGVNGAMVIAPPPASVTPVDDPRPACGADAWSLCDDRVRSPASASTCYRRPETGLQCLVNHFGQLSSNCKAIVSPKPLYQCRNDIAAYCDYARGELEETKECILNRIVLLSQPCADALKAEANEAANEFKQACLPSAQAVCPQFVGNFPVLLNCLLTNFGQLQPTCQQAIKLRVANN